ncbi:uncharacterized protein LOC107272267 [Cephus cinctus]|uniref:Uncharacterized protein LOC107272267 n=1 Tax=Cephus cinctus TaxID=211228 RepID=A0AAJ7W5L7_CEPCN|nr:uncharacterized protein LOC107272267 [Cephus cinctus]
MADLLRELQGPRAYRLVILTLTLVNGCHVSLHTYDHFTRIYSSFSEINNITIFPNNIRKLNGFKLKVAAAHNPPYVYLDRDKTTGQANNMDGPDIQMINIISKQLDLDIEFLPRFNELFNGKSSNGKPIGVVVELFEHKHDLTANSIYIHTYNEQFSRFAEMTRPYNYATLSVMILSNGAVSVVNSFVGVKELTIVCCCLLAAIWLGLSVVPRDHPATGILKTLGSLLGSGVPLYPKWWSAKLSLMSFTVLFAIMSTDLQSLLTSSLIYEIVPNDIKTLRELESNEYSLLLGEGHYNMCFGHNHEQNNHSNYYTRLQARAKILENKQLCVQRLLEGGKNGKIGCVIETYIGLWFIKKFSELVIVEETLLTHWKGFVFFKGYYALPMVNKVLSILTENGITNKIIGDYVGIRRKVIPKNVTYRLTLKNFYNTIYVIVILYAISIIVFLIEILIGRYTKI